MTNPFPPIRRIVTGHDASGRAVFASDNRFASEPIALGGAEFALLWTTAAVPADNNDPVDGRERDAGLTIDRGSVIRVVDFLPGGDSPFHRTNSIDYGIVLEGEITLILDEGETVVRAGDIVIQRGTNHGWANRGTVPCRIAFILIDGRYDPELAP